MANQYSGNFEQIVKNRFKCSAREILLKCQREGLSYQDAEKVLGLSMLLSESGLRDLILSSLLDLDLMMSILNKKER